MDCTYEEMRRVPEVLQAIEDALAGEQGGLCAYTGHRIGIPSQEPVDRPRKIEFHVEHLAPQKHCGEGEDTAYSNLVACWPRPNCDFEPNYGARRKGDWPPPEHGAAFVSPLRPDCTERFAFNRRGEIGATRAEDAAAAETIVRLGLNEPALAQLRREAIRGALEPAGRLLKLAEARKLMARMKRASEDVDQGASIQLIPFCFAIEQALAREIRKLEAIRHAPPAG